MRRARRKPFEAQVDAAAAALAKRDRFDRCVDLLAVHGQLILRPQNGEIYALRAILLDELLPDLAAVAYAEREQAVREMWRDMADEHRRFRAEIPPDCATDRALADMRSRLRR